MKDWFFKTFFPNWVLIKSYRGKWIVNDDFGKRNEYCVYEIYYSEIRDKYKLKCCGTSPKEHSIYPQVVDILNAYRKGEL